MSFDAMQAWWRSLLPPLWEGATSQVLALGGATLAGTPVSALFLSFVLFSFIGWVFEALVCSLANHGRFINTGFLLGPVSPIYGVGALACWFLLRQIPVVAVQFIAASVVCCSIEYAVGWLLERTTQTRFWDYSNFPLNIHGRVCLYGALLFGTGCVLICRVIEPWLLYVLSLLPDPVLLGIALAIAALLAIDTVFTLLSWRSLSAKLEALRSDMAERLNDGLGEASDKLLESMPADALKSMGDMQTRSRAVNGWLLTISDAALDALRSYRKVPTLTLTGGRQRLEAAAERLKLTFDKRDLRFFYTLPDLRMKRFDGIIRATDLRERARELFRRDR